ncbi:glycoside hydrolase family 3 N-terminal domain-containing protein [Lewinella sp. W8]|uniref:glycoside hydrolase family 3 N-terminal domain-containing protein n=1 Tax=Lewinella sp. W8 TaxID=2528208 RepID=UPI001068A5DB|nr:glycoside hydrolase family 3 N-terminal domain-containing protein [Lewinella sp. W8]MTB50123.1 beta-glucosidase [Lewinella sp. W8]
MSERVEDLLSRMTVAEKAGQMTQVTIDLVSEGKAYKLRKPLKLSPEKLREIIVTRGVGSILNVGTSAHTPTRWREILQDIQAAATDTRLGIPVLYGIDSIHGANYVMGSTLFPQQLGLAATGNPELVEELFALSARDTVTAGIPWLFSPSADFCRDPRWPRLWETFGEDVRTGEVLTAAAVRGIERVRPAASCLKHYLGYGAPVSGKDRTPAWVPERQLREYFVPAFRAGIRAGAPSIMVNSAEINGIPVHANPKLLRELLRDELGFTGVLVTDWEDIVFLYDRHRIADSYRSAVRIAIEAGIDLSMTPLETEFTDHLIDLVATGEIPESRLDESVRRILTLKEHCGLFDAPIPPAFPQSPERDRALARQAAEESVVLCRNEAAALPLRSDEKILVVGPTANSKRSLHGGWTYTWQGEQTDELDPEEHPSVLSAIEEEFGAAQVNFFPGCTHEAGSLNLEGFAEAAAKVDTIVLCLGESSYTEFFGSLNDLYLPDDQADLARAAVRSGKKIVLLLLEGRPRVISHFADDIPAVLVAFLPGHGGPAAIAGILSGRVNPSGRLPVTYPRYPNSLTPYDHKSSENREIQGAPIAYQPEFEFGTGLSYTDWQYQDLKVSKTRFSPEDPLEVSVTLINAGDRDGEHIVQLFSTDHYASVAPSVRRLRKFKRIRLEAGQRTKVSFSLTARDLAFVGLHHQWIAEAGDFSLQVGALTRRVFLTETQVSSS